MISLYVKWTNEFWYTEDWLYINQLMCPFYRPANSLYCDRGMRP